MRLGICGSHATGKSTLVAELSNRLGDFEAIEEAYYLMAADGEAFSSPPTDAEYESMIERSIFELSRGDAINVLFDRTPLDYLAYLAVVRRDVRGTFEEWLPVVRESLKHLQAIVFVPIEEPDRVRASTIELRKTRKQVHLLLQDMLLEDAWRLGIPVVEVSGSTAERVEHVVQWLRDHILLVPHNTRWASEFLLESNAIRGALGTALIDIEHIGSTSIAGISAKPIIDMLLIVDDVCELDEHASQLEKLGYEPKGEFGIPGRRYFRKDSSAGIRTHHVHAFAKGSPHIARHLNFRDYLRAHPHVAHEYELLKRRLADQFGHDAASYGDGKTGFINRVEALAASRSASS